MGVAQPTLMPEWATDGAAERTAPTTDQQDFGYPAGAIPTAEELNYLFCGLWLWVDWLRNQDQFDRCFIPRAVGSPSAWSQLDGLGTAGLTSSGVGDAMIDLGEHLRDGDVLRSVVFTLEGNGTADLTVYLYKRPVSGATATQLATKTFSNMAASPRTTANFDTIISGGHGPEFDSAEPLVLIVAANASGIKICHVQITGDRRAP